MEIIVHRRVIDPSPPVLAAALTLSETSLGIVLQTDAAGTFPIVSYSLQRSTDAATWGEIASGANVFASGGTYTDAGLTVSTTYYYRCRATDTTGRVSGYGYTSGYTAPPPNAAPVWQEGWTLSIQAGSSASVAGYASDPNGDAITFARSGGTAPAGVAVSLSGMVSAPVGTTAGDYTLAIECSDGSLTDTVTVALTITSAATGFPLHAVYSALVTNFGGTPIPTTNVRYWDVPTYPTTGTVYASVAALNAAIAAAAAGTILRLQDGTYANATINCGTDGVTVAAQSKGGVNLSGNSVVNVTGDSVDVMGFNFTGPYSTQNCVDVTGTDAVVAYCTITITARGTAGTPDYTQIKNLINAFGARTRVCYCTETGYRGAGRFVEVLKSAAPYPTYCRIDHNYVADHWCAVDTGGAELYKIGQAQYDVDYYALVDNNHTYRWGNDAGTSGPNSEREQTSIKSSANILIQNVYEECRGSVNLRHAWDCGIYGNFFLGGGFADAGGIGMFGRNHLVACNYMSDLNSGGNVQTAGLRIGNGNDVVGDYWAARNCEVSHNTLYNVRRALAFSPLSDRTYVPDGNVFYSNAIDINVAHVAIAVITAADADTNTAWAGNVVEPPTGRAAAGITAATPALTLANGVRATTAGGNCDGTADGAVSALVSVDALGTVRPAAGADVGAFQAAATVNPWQTIIDAAGAA